MSEEVLKARDVGRLQKKVITNKQGKKQTVYVSNQQEQPADKKPKKEEDSPSTNKKPIATGGLKVGGKVYGEDGKSFTVKKNVKMDFHGRDKSGNLVFEHEGKNYTIHKKHVEGHKDGSEEPKSGEHKEGEMTDKHKERATNIGQRIKESIGKFSKKQKEFFDSGQFLEGSDTRTKIADFVKAKKQGIIKALKHEVKEVKLAASGIKKALTPPPRPEIDHHEKDALKALGKHLALTVGTMIATGGIGALAHGVMETAGHIVVHFLEHVGILSAAKSLAFAKGEEDDSAESDKEVDKVLGQLINKLSNHMKSGKITDKEWVTMFSHSDSMNKELGLGKKKDDKDVEKGEKVSIDKEVFVKEHKKLLKVLKSPSRKDDKEEYEEQKKELKNITKSIAADNEHPESMPDGFSYENYMTMSKGIKREDMPQVDEENIDEFLIHFSNKAKLKKVKVKLKDLKPTQSEINEDKVIGMIKDKYDWKSRKYIISKDNYLMDAHHAWATGLEDDPDYEVTCYKVSLPINNLLRRAKQLKISKKRDIKDNEIKKAIEVINHVLNNPELYSKEDFEKAQRFNELELI